MTYLASVAVALFAGCDTIAQPAKDRFDLTLTVLSRLGEFGSEVNPIGRRAIASQKGKCRNKIPTHRFPSVICHPVHVASFGHSTVRLTATSLPCFTPFT